MRLVICALALAGLGACAPPQPVAMGGNGQYMVTCDANHPDSCARAANQTCPNYDVISTTTPRSYPPSIDLIYRCKS